MKRDAWYAGIAAMGLLAAAALYGLVNAHDIADPAMPTSRSELKASLPSPPVRDPHRETRETALTILRERNPFAARSQNGSGEGIGLELPKLAPPVRFSNPGEQATVTAVPSREAAAPAPAPAPQNEPETRAPVSPAPASPARPTQGTLTLRGVFPSPNGGRALVALPDGRVVSVGVGGIVGGWRVIGIQQGAIRIGRGQRAILLTMPR